MIITQRTPNVVSVDAPAKINLFLEVLNRRPDGFHTINSLFQAVSLYDHLTFTRTDQPGITLTVSGHAELPANDDNLVVRACRLLFEQYNLAGGLDISLTKQIPVAAGLAGGSSDAAAAIAAVDRLFHLNLTRNDKARLGLELGSDIPFFFTRGQALVGGRGEILTETDYPTNYHLLLVNPGFPISTAAAYTALKRGLTDTTVPYTLPCSRTVERHVQYLSHTGNDFEPVHAQSFPELEAIKAWLLARGAVLARLSGSGPTVFGIFLHDPDAGQGTVTESRGNWRIDAVKPITLPSQLM